MTVRKFLIFAVLTGILVGCGEEFGEEMMKKKIRNWWDTRLIDDVIIVDYLKEDTAITVLSKLVVGSDTTVRTEYKFKQAGRGWKIDRGPVDEKIKDLCIQSLRNTPIEMSRRTVLKTNMRNLQSVLEIYGVSEGMGTYPTYLINENSEVAKFISSYLGGEMKNPYLPDELPVIDAVGDTSDWFCDYIGKIVYFPWVEDDSTASGYVIRGSTGIGFINMVLVGGSRMGEREENN
jgi:hypothetical protein